MRRKELLAFVHIEKTAGTSMIHLLRHNYLLRYLDVRPLNHSGRVFKATDLELYLKLCPVLRAIGGHSVVPWSDLESVADVKYITLLRDPVRRYVSQYRYWLSHLGKDVTIEEYLGRQGPRNLQVKRLAGEENLEKAIETIEHKFLCVGVVEQFDSYLKELESILGSSQFSAFRIEENINRKNTTAADEIIEKYKDAIVECNQIDISLYRYVTKRIAAKNRSEITEDSGLGTRRRTAKLFLDYMFRKAYVEPVTGIIRRHHGLSPAGSF